MKIQKLLGILFLAPLLLVGCGIHPISSDDRSNMKSVALPSAVTIPAMYIQNAGGIVTSSDADKIQRQLNDILKKNKISLQNIILTETKAQLRAKNSIVLNKNSPYRMEVKVLMYGYFLDIRPIAKILNLSEARPNITIQASIYQGNRLVWRHAGYVTIFGPIPKYSVATLQKNPALMSQQYQKMAKIALQQVFQTL